MNDKNKNIIIIRFISIIIMFIYALFLFIDISSQYTTNSYSIYLKFSSIILCFIISLFIGPLGYTPKDVLKLKLARFFTLVADYFLLISNNHILGVLLFCVVQLIYIERHSLMEKHVTIKKLNPFIFLPSFTLFLIFTPLILYLTNYLVLLAISSFVYALLLTFSVYCSIRTLKYSSYTKKSSLFISCGMVLFLLCDINVALYQLISMDLIPSIWENFQFIIGLLIWIFYLPSQLLLTLSGIKSDS
ncbi:hypothetical protein [Oceanirhabdus sp. W0125-5]|uniref:hypothetical protein n=1 Tax=Oceanirhabdus sp. W0125-5 TaxID=2999116 RepID=UPI0022F318AE|nr:hypothetical protein [Oceanirhabdus sp. W0125-5]WBW97135.1 hypothetical protein OW730_26105 [Oceanirhabdus sp. W0125-5]